METNNRLREALECIANNLENRLFCRYPCSATDEWMWQKARAALAEPVKNFEVGTAEEQLKRFKDFCRIISKDETCDGCLLLAQSSRLGHCVLDWTQMPYEEGETK